MDKSDKKWIDENVHAEINQWSIKLDNGEIFMIQRFTEEDLFSARKSYLDKINSRAIPEPASVPTAQTTTFVPPAPTSVSPSVICPICGSKAYINEGVSKAGKPYKIQKCSKFPELTTKGGHSFWMK